MIKIKVFQSLPEVLLYALLILSLVFNIIGQSINSNNAKQAKVLAAQNQKFAKDSQDQTVIARQQNIQRQMELKSYIECVVLIGKANPTVNFQTATFDQTKAILDQCAVSQVKE